MTILTPLEYLEERLNNPWLLNYSAEKFFNSTQNYFKQFKENNHTIIISTSNNFEFLAQFIAAASINCQVFLVNPIWTESEQPEIFNNNSFSSIMIPTGGSSGKVKFAQHTWQTLKDSVEGFSTYFDSPKVNAVCLLPLYHVSGLMQAIRSLITGGKLLIYDYHQLKKQPPQTVNYADYFISLVPTQLKFLLAYYPHWLKQFKTVLLGGAPAWNGLLETARKAEINLALTYGMTETASQIVTLKPTDFLQGNISLGKPLPHAKVTIENERGEKLPPEQIGTIVVESRSLFLGYYSGDTSQISSFKTDDLGYFDQAGYLYIVGRKSQKIITGGEKVYPAEVEEILLNTGLIKDVAVIGYPDNYWGEVVTAIYVTQKEVNLEEIKAAIIPVLTYYKRPKKWLEVEEIPRNQQGKVIKTQLEEMIKTNL